ncbi:MAG TPA: hypothetical protein VNU70_13940, partial [Puia sp.]|nr:hypothetical protein [Puia sp.]
PPLPVAAEQTIANQAIANSLFFRKTSATATPGKPEQKDLSLNLGDIVAEKKKSVPGSASDTATEKNKLYTVANPAYENQRLQADGDLREIDEERKTDVLEDAYIRVAYLLTAGMIKP